MAGSKLQNSLDTSFNQLFFCEMTIGDAEVIPENIISLTIREWALDVVPRLYCILNDDGMLTEIFNISDGEKITLLLGKHPEDENTIKLDFTLQDFKMNLVSDNKYSIVSFTGILDISKLYFPIKNRSFANKNSKEVLRQIAEECNLTFKSPYNFKTNDRMTWYQINIPNWQFINYVKKRAFKEDDMILSYIDINKKLYLTSLKTEINKQEEKIAIYDQENYTKFSFEDETDKNTIWYNYYDYVNISGKYNKINNYKTEYNYYDLSDNVESSIKSNLASFTNLTFKNKSNLNNTVKHTYCGIINNEYDNYAKAMIQNEYYKQNFFAFAMALNINSLSKVYLLDKINVIIPAMPTYGGELEINDRLSGYYLVVGQVYNIGKNKTFNKQIILSRDGENNSQFLESKKNA